MLRSGGESAEKKLSRQVVKKAFEAIGRYYAGEKEKRELAESYITGLSGKPAVEHSEEAKEKIRQRSWITSCKTALEEYRSAYKEEARYTSTQAVTVDSQISRLEALAKITDDQEFQQKLEEARNEQDLAGIMRFGRIAEQEQAVQIAKLEYKRLLDEQLGSEARKEEVWGLYGGYAVSERNRKNTEAMELVAGKIAAGETESPLTSEDLYKRIEELSEAAEGLEATGIQALENHKTALIRQRAAAEALDRRGVLTKENAKSQAQAAKKKLRTGKEKLQEYQKWEYQIYTLEGSLGILATQAYEGLSQTEKESLEQYVSWQILASLTAQEIQAGTDAGKLIEAIEKRPSGKSGSSTEKENSWEVLFKKLETGIKERLAAKTAAAYHGTGEYEAAQPYIEWLILEEKLKNREIGEAEYRLSAEQYRGNEQIQRTQEAMSFLSGYKGYLRAQEGITGGNGQTEEEKKQKLLALQTGYEKSLGEQEKTWLTIIRNERSGDWEEDWYAYRLGGQEIFKQYLLSREGNKWIEKTSKYLREDTDRSEVESYGRQVRSVAAYAGLIDGDVGKWLERYKTQAGLSAEEAEGVYRCLTRGIEIKNVQGHKERQKDLMGATGAGWLAAVEQEVRRGAVEKTLKALTEGQRKSARRLESEARYLVELEQEVREDRLKWIRTAREARVFEVSGIETKEETAVRQTIVEQSEAERAYLKRLGKEAELHGNWFRDAQNKIVSQDGYQSKERETDELSEQVREKQRGYYKSIDSLGKEQRAAAELERLSLAGLAQEAAVQKLEKKAKDAELAQGEYERQWSDWEKKGKRVTEAYLGYSAAVEASEILYGEIEKARLVQRSAQEIHDWAASVYLKGFGENESAEYQSPLERLGETERSYKRAELSLEVLEEVRRGESGKDEEYTRLEEQYREAYRAYYTARAAVSQGQGQIAKQEQAVREAERAEREARGGLVAKRTGKEELPVQTQLIRIRREETTDSRTGEKKQNYKISLSSEAGAGELDTDLLREYLGDESGEEQGIDGAVQLSKAESDTAEWLKVMEGKGEEYLETVALAALHIKAQTTGEQRKSLLKGEKDPFRNGLYGIGDLDMGRTYHEIAIGAVYLQARKEVLKEAYESVMGRGGSGDIGRYILYRETTLAQQMKERENKALESRALGKVEQKIRTKAEEFQVQAIVTFSAMTACLYAWQFLAAGALLIVGLFKQDQASSSRELARTVQGVRSGTEGNLEVERDRERQAYGKWKSARMKLEAEQGRLRELEWGSREEQKGELDYERFRKAVGMLLEGSVGIISGEEKELLMGEEEFRASKAGKAGSAVKALARIAEYRRMRKNGQELKLSNREAELKREQEDKGALYGDRASRVVKPSGEEEKKLKELSMKAADRRRTAEEREEAAKEYRLLTEQLLKVPKAVREELKALAVKAYGSGSYSGKKEILGLLAIEEELLGLKTCLGKEVEAYTAEAAGEYLKKSLKAYDEDAAKRLAAKKTEWAVQAADYTKQKAAWKTQVDQIQALARTEWTKAEEKLREGYKRWRKDLTEQYARKSREWETNYARFINAKGEWLDEQYLYASNSASAGLSIVN